MRLPPSPPELVELWEEIAPDGPDVVQRKMFGYPSVFVGGNLACGLHRDRLLVRLGGTALSDALALAGAEQFEPMPGRAMKHYVLLPPALHADRDAVAGWLDRAVAFARSLPPKAPKPKAPRPAPGKRNSTNG